MIIGIPTVYHKVAAYSLLFILLFPSQVVYSLQSHKLRCNPDVNNYDTASTKCPIHQICTADGVCELLGQDLARTQRKRHFSPFPNTASKSLTFKKGRCGEHFGGARCDSKSKFRSCCSRRGWCGSSPAHCRPENGCQQGCIVDPELTIQRRETRENNTEQTSEPLINTNPFPARVGKPLPAPKHEAPGQFKVAGDSGVPAMHAALMPNGNVVFLDKIENYTKLQFENGEFAYSSEWDPVSGKVTPLTYKVGLILRCAFFRPQLTLLDKCLLLRRLVSCFRHPDRCWREWTFASCCTLYFEWLRRNTLSYTQFVIQCGKHRVVVRAWQCSSIKKMVRICPDHGRRVRFRCLR